MNQAQAKLDFAPTRKRERLKHTPGLDLVQKRIKIPECALRRKTSQGGCIRVRADFPLPGGVPADRRIVVLNRLAGVVENLLVYPENMQKNIDRLGGLVHSQRVMLALTQAGVSREDAYAAVQENAMKVWRGEGRFIDFLKADPRVTLLADPTDRDMQELVNLKIKFRESFRPFCPSVLEEDSTLYFEGAQAIAPYMTITYNVKPEAQGQLPAITHIDNTAANVNTPTTPTNHATAPAINWAITLGDGLPISGANKRPVCT